MESYLKTFVIDSPHNYILYKKVEILNRYLLTQKL
jgi:hypothetical protein